MSWSIREKDIREMEQLAPDDMETAQRSRPEVMGDANSHLFQIFSDEEWGNYPFADEEDMRWFREAKYGLFVHMGLSALGKVDIGWSRHTHKLPDTGNGSIPDEVYDGWSRSFELKDFDAEEWIKLAVKGGMKYVVIVAKHHDGFHMWDTKFSEHKITNSPFGRDYLKELTDVCHKYGMKVGIYYSQRDWYHPDYEPVTAELFEVCGSHPPFKKDRSERLVMTEKHKRYIEYMHNTVMELMTNYGRIDVLWWDAVYWNGMFEEEMWETYEIERKVREAQPYIIINNRGSVPGDFDTPECRIGYFQNYRPWETCMPLGDAWAWTGTGVRSRKEVVKDLVNCVCGDGNYLLSIGARPDGNIDAPETERIRDVGEWLETAGESIYGTAGGPYLPNADYGTTHKGNVLYVHILNEEAGELRLKRIEENRLKGAEVLTGGRIDLQETEDDYVIRIQEHDGIDLILKMTFEHNIEETELIGRRD